MVDDLLRFSRHTFSASALALSISQARRAPNVIGMNEAFLGEHFSQGISVAPFSASLDSGTACSSLWQLQAKTTADAAIASYATFLGKHGYGYGDEMDLVFTFEDIPIAVLSLFGEQRFQLDPADATHLHEFLSSFIACHPFTKKWRRQRGASGYLRADSEGDRSRRTPAPGKLQRPDRHQPWHQPNHGKNPCSACPRQS